MADGHGHDHDHSPATSPSWVDWDLGFGLVRENDPERAVLDWTSLNCLESRDSACAQPLGWGWGVGQFSIKYYYNKYFTYSIFPLRNSTQGGSMLYGIPDFSIFYILRTLYVRLQFTGTLKSFPIM